MIVDQRQRIILVVAQLERTGEREAENPGLHPALTGLALLILWGATMLFRTALFRTLEFNSVVYVTWGSSIFGQVFIALTVLLSFYLLVRTHGELKPAA